MKKDVSASTGHQNLEEVHGISFYFTTSSSRRNIKTGLHRLAPKNFQSYLQRESLCEWVIQWVGLQKRKPHVYLSPFCPSGAFNSKSLGHMEEPLFQPSISPACWGETPKCSDNLCSLPLMLPEGWDGFMSRFFSISWGKSCSSLQLHSHGMYMTWKNISVPQSSQDHTQDSEQGNSSCCYREASKMTVEVFKKAYSKGLECFFLNFFTACVVFFWLSNSWMIE